MARENSKYLSYKQKRSIEDALAHVLKPLNAEKTLWEYEDGITDKDMLKRIQAFVPIVTINHVRSIRTECFGPLKKPQWNGTDKGLDEIRRRLDNLENNFQKLLERLGERTS